MELLLGVLTVVVLVEAVVLIVKSTKLGELQDDIQVLSQDLMRWMKHYEEVDKKINSLGDQLGYKWVDERECGWEHGWVKKSRRRDEGG